MEHADLLMIAAGTAIFFRLVPFLLGRRDALFHRTGKFYRFLSYSAQAMLGVMCFESSFGKNSLTQILYYAEVADLLKLALLVAAFSYTALTQRVVAPFLLAATIYFATIFYL